MPSDWDRSVQAMRPAIASLSAADAREQNRLDDLNPANFRMIDQELRRRDMQAPRQQEALMDERKRLEAVQEAQVRQAAQTFQQRLEQRTMLSTHTGMETPSPESFMAKLMLMMQRRNKGTPAQPNVPQWNNTYGPETTRDLNL